MLVRDMCTRHVVCAPGTTSVAEAAVLMRTHRVGDVVVIDRADAERMPIGIVTDRDVAVEVVARGLDPAAVTLGDLVRWGQLVTAQETDTYVDTLRLMRDKGIRRLPVIDAAGVLAGIITIDDMLPLIADELAQLAALGQRGRQRETEPRA
jgi:CBS domain-containing protein